MMLKSMGHPPAAACRFSFFVVLVYSVNIRPPAADVILGAYGLCFGLRACLAELVIHHHSSQIKRLVCDFSWHGLVVNEIHEPTGNDDLT